MTSPDPVQILLADFSHALPGMTDLGAALRHVSQLTRAAVPGCSGASVTLGHDEGNLTMACSDDRTAELDEVQYGIGSGPCLDALVNDVVHEIDDLILDVRWPVFAAAAATSGVKQTLSVPLRLVDGVIGVLNIYADDPGFGEGAREAAEQVARQAGGLLHTAGLYFDARHLADNLSAALDSRAVIEQAKGVIMAQSRCSADAAFSFLAQASMRENVKLRDVAARIVTSVAQGATRRTGPGVGV